MGYFQICPFCSKMIEDARLAPSHRSSSRRGGWPVRAQGAESKTVGPAGVGRVWYAGWTRELWA
jgi:hypothetical protein